jgi:uncharacterized membrane protein YeaQ/YmgE (transglycosylase-associated protein family)
LVGNTISRQKHSINLIIYLALGGLAGFLTGKAMKDVGFGFIPDIIIGVVSGLLGRMLSHLAEI